MSRFLLLLTFFSLYSTLVSAQDPSLCNQVLGATGKSTTLNGRYYAYTIGEVVVNTVSDNQRAITQGFHQPDLCLPVSTDNVELAKWAIEVFPNPTDNILRISYDGLQQGHLTASVIDLWGHVLIENFRLDTPAGTELPCAELASGVYLLRIREMDGQSATTIRFVKI